MSNDLFGNSGIKCISHTFTFFYKNVLPYFVGSISIVISLILLVTKFYFPLVFVLPISIVIIFSIVKAFQMPVADEAYLDYKNKEFIFLYEKGEKKIRKSFKDLTEVRKMAMGQTIELAFNENEKYFFYSSQTLGPLPSNSVYQEIKFILDNRMGEFLTEYEDVF